MAGGKGTSTDKLLGMIRGKGKSDKAVSTGARVAPKPSGKGVNPPSVRKPSGQPKAPAHKRPPGSGTAAKVAVPPVGHSSQKNGQDSAESQVLSGGSPAPSVSEKQQPVASQSPPPPPLKEKVSKSKGQGKKRPFEMGKKGAVKKVGGAEKKRVKRAGNGKAVKKAAAQRLPFSFSKKSGGVTIGVDLGPDSLRLAKVSNSGGRQKLLGYKRIPYDPAMLPGSAGFVDFLRSKLREFVSGVRKPQIWSLVSSAKAELWHITIPKVPRRQIVEAVYWSVKKEKQFEESEFLLDFDVVGEVSEKGVPKLAVTVCLVPRAQVDEVANLFAKAGFKLHGLTIAPIALQTLFRSSWIATDAGTCANLYVGRNWSRIDIFDKGNLVLSRGIKAGVNSMVDSLVDGYNQQHGFGESGISIDELSGGEPVISMEVEPEDNLTLDLSQDSASAPGNAAANMDIEQGKLVLFSKLLGTPKTMSGPGSELGERGVLDLVLPSIERLVRQIERTFEYHSTTMGNEPVEQIFFSSVVCTNKLLLQYIYSQLGIESLVLDPLDPDNPNMARVAGPDTAVERLEYNLVLALALSDDSITPNFLFTFREREKVKQSQMIDKLIYLATIVLLVILAGVYMWQGSRISAANIELATLKQRLAAYTPKVNDDMLKELAEQVHQRNRKMKMASLRYQSLGSLGEIFSSTSKNVNILNIKMDLGPYVPLPSDDAGGDKKKRQPKNKGAAKLITVEGFIEGPEQDKYDDELTRYIIKLENSVMFTVPIIDQNEIERFGARGEVLHFVIHFNTP